MVQKVSKTVRYTVEPCSAILAYMVKVVTLTAPTHVANNTNEWLPIQTCWNTYGAISLIQSKFLKYIYKTPNFTHSVCTYKKFCLKCFVGPEHYITFST